MIFVLRIGALFFPLKHCLWAGHLGAEFVQSLIIRESRVLAPLLSQTTALRAVVFSRSVGFAVESPLKGTVRVHEVERLNLTAQSTTNETPHREMKKLPVRRLVGYVGILAN